MVIRASVCQAGRCCCQDLIGLVAGSISAGPTVLGERANETKIDRGQSPRVDRGHGEARDRERRDRGANELPLRGRAWRTHGILRHERSSFENRSETVIESDVAAVTETTRGV